MFRPCSPTQHGEQALHKLAKKAGLSYPCDLSYLEIPVCSGHDDDGCPTMEIKAWPFLLPQNLET